jgi:hypothetical protein
MTTRSEAMIALGTRSKHLKVRIRKSINPARACGIFSASTRIKEMKS